MAGSLGIYWVDAFTTERFTGNSAAVVPDASELSDRQMQTLAREMNCSETVFVLRPTETEAHLRLRWFTPTQEVPLCGHATIAAMHVLAEMGYYNLKPGFQQILYVETLTGVLAVIVDFRKSSSPWIWLTLPRCSFEPLSPRQQDALQRAFPGLDASFQSAVLDSLNQDILLRVASLTGLQHLTPDFAALKTLGTAQGWRGFSVFTTEVADAQHGAQSRFFAPQSGILEDPVTGSASVPLALYLKQQGLAVGDRIILEQGHCLQRPGLIHVDLSEETPRCGGQAVTVLTGVLND